MDNTKQSTNQPWKMHGRCGDLLHKWGWSESSESDCGVQNSKQYDKSHLTAQLNVIQIEDELGTERGAWFIPRPALCRNSTTCSCNSADMQVANSIQTVSEWLTPSSTPSSKSSTQSGTSGTLLLTAANLAALRLEQGHGHGQGHKPHDTTSLASSTHFTVVNGMWRKPRQTTADCCRACHKHQLTSVVLSVCGLFLLGLCLAIYFIDRRARTKLS